MIKYFVGAVIIVILGAVGYVVWSKAQAGAAPVTPPEEVPALPVTHTYASSTFSIVYPDGYTVDENYHYEGVPKKPIAGVKFVIPGTTATGTNLSTDSGVSVESLPRAAKCTGDIFLYQNVKPATVTVGSRTWSVASTSDAGAGNLYEEQVFALVDSKPCLAIRYFIHYGNIGNYPEGAVTEFDRSKLLADFDQIRDSIVLRGEAPQTASTTESTQQ